MVSTFNLLNDNNFQAFIATSLLTPIMLAGPPYSIFNFLFMSRVSSGEGLCRFAYILAMALLAGSKINYIRALAVDLLFNWVDFSSVGASKGFCFSQDWTSMTLFLASGTPCIHPSSAPSLPPLFGPTTNFLRFLGCLYAI